jgi:hypothetical protein
MRLNALKQKEMENKTKPHMPIDVKIQKNIIEKEYNTAKQNLKAI